MSTLRVNYITNKFGDQGPVIAGITTVSSDSHMVVPSGDTRMRTSELVTSGLTYHIDASIPTSYSGTGTIVNNLGSAGSAYKGYWFGSDSTGTKSPAMFDPNEGGGSWFLEGMGGDVHRINYLMISATANAVPGSLMGDSNGSSLGFTNSFTQSWWSKCLRLGGQNRAQPILTLNNHTQASHGGTKSGINMSIGTDGAIDFQTRLGATCCQTLNGAAGTVTGRWQNTTVTYDGALKKMYLDGNLIGQAANTGTMVMKQSVYFGANSDNVAADPDGASIYAFRGYLAKIMMYSRAITQDEVYRLYASQKYRFPDQA